VDHIAYGKIQTVLRQNLKLILEMHAALPKVKSRFLMHSKMKVHLANNMESICRSVNAPKNKAPYHRSIMSPAMQAGAGVPICS
jgi:hypothetical protein